VGSYDWTWGIVPRALPALLRGLELTLLITVVVIVLGFGLGIFVAAGRLARNPLVNKPVAAYIEFFRGTPALVQLVWIYYCLPIVLGLELPSVASIVLALTLNVGAFYGEAIRAGIQAVPRDQTESADILGLSYVDKMRYVVLPQAFRIIIPVALSQSISLFKDTALVSTLGVADLMYQARVIATETYRPLEILTVAALIYFVLAFPCTIATRVLELRLARARH
jgi:polar amino acid transport system permease protein